MKINVSAWLVGVCLASIITLTGCKPESGSQTPAGTPSTPTNPPAAAKPAPAPAPAPAAEAPKPAAQAPAPAATADEVAIIKTSAGEMIVEFWPDVAPNTVENFKKLARQGTYDGTAFHRVIRGFMIQGGDPLSKDEGKKEMWGTGDAGYKIKAEFNDRQHVKGVLSMARSRHPDSAGSQFFICHGTASHLDHQYTAFGKLIKGEEVLDSIAHTDVGGPQGSTPLTRQNVESIKIVPRSSLK